MPPPNLGGFGVESLGSNHVDLGGHNVVDLQALDKQRNFWECHAIFFSGIRGSKLSNVDRALVHLARALISKPNFLVMHKPTEMFAPSMRKAVSESVQSYH